MLENANTSNNMMAEYNNTPNSRTSPKVSPETAANPHTAKVHGSNGGVISEYSSGQKPKSDEAVSPAETNGNKVSPESADAQNKMNTAASSAQTESKDNSVKSSYINGQGCTPNRSRFPAQTPVTMAYVPFQHIDSIYSPEEGLVYGTIFPELNKPFLGGGMEK
ncbi:MAG: Spore coat associated protein JA (CotJA) [Clostridium sp.]